MLNSDKENKFAQIEEEKEKRLLELEELKLSEEAKQQMILDVENAFKEKKKINITKLLQNIVIIIFKATKKC